MNRGAPIHRGRDLDDEVEIAELVRRFYADVAQDDLLGPIFEDVAHVDWVEHLPKLTAFWCRILLSKPGYEGNPFRAPRGPPAVAVHVRPLRAVARSLPRRG
ncbi:MAG: group III truncated hemoglobin [Acidimicrobiales bacterium]